MPRFNKSPNPSCANNVVGIRGLGTFTRLTGLTGTPRATGVSVPTTSTAFGAAVGGAATGCAPGQTWTGVGWVRSSVARTVRIDLVRWENGTFRAATNFTDVALSANVWTKVRIVATLPAGDFNEINWHADLPGAGTAGTLSISSWRLEQVSDTGLEYGDGDDAPAGWSWDGTAGNSTSTLSDTPPPPVDVPVGTPPADGGGLGSGGAGWSLTPSYELVAVARIPQLSGPPLFEVVEAIAWDRLSWTDEVSRPQRIDVGCSVDTLPDSIVARMENLKENPTELWVLRDGVIEAAGPLFGWLRQGDTVTMHAAGILGYAAYMFVEETLAFTATDQFTIAKALIEHWQTKDYGHLGIDTSSIGTSGVTRDATYERSEINSIGKHLQALGERENGFDIEVDPASRRLRLWFPRQGVDRSSGADAIVLDTRNITSPNITASVAPGDLASEAYGVGTGPGIEDSLWSHKPNVQVRATYGRVGVAQTFDGVSDQVTLDAHTAKLQASRGNALIIPGPAVQSTPDADLAGYRAGDSVAYRFAGRLGASGRFRIRKRNVSLDKTAVENIALEFE